jgi:hypothetical protein
MKRNLEKAYQEGDALKARRPQLDLSLSEVDALYNEYKAVLKDRGPEGAAFVLLDRAFSIGLAIGNRNA